MRENPRKATQRALDLHRQGRLTEADRVYASILAQSPDYFDALHLRGLLRMHQGNPSEALPLIEAAVRLKPNSVEALSVFGAVLLSLDHHQNALEKYERILKIEPTNVDALYNRGVVLSKLGRDGESLASYERALAIRPNHGFALFNRGNLLAELGRYEPALESLDRALAAMPQNSEVLNNRGNVLAKLERHVEAIASFDKALAIRPTYVTALTNRGNAFKQLKRYAEALASFEHALRIQPDNVVAAYNCGNALVESGRLEEALAYFDMALTIEPNHADGLSARAYALFNLRRPGEAVECYRRALTITPDDAVLHTNLIFALNFIADASMADLQIERERWYQSHGERFATNAIHGNEPDPDRRLRIGYVSSHFRDQASVYAFGGVILNHDPDRFETVCYSDTLEGDDVTRQLEASVTKWHRTTHLSDDELAQLIRADQIDILVDAVGHMKGHRLLVFARKPAPIQMTAWGEPTGTGIKSMDYLLADPVLIPARDRSVLTERVVDLPNFLGYWRPGQLPEPSQLPAIERGYITFGSFNRFAKILDSVLRLWATVLRAIPDAHLVLKPVDVSQRSRVEAIFADEGVAPERLTLLGESQRFDHFVAYQQIDIALDPFPHGGGMTTLDALWMGVPVVTLAGHTISSRLAAASLTALDLADFVAIDKDGYVRLAVAKAADLGELAALRAGLRERIANSAIGDVARYARAVEAAYRGVWQQWCARSGSESGDHLKALVRS